MTVKTESRFPYVAHARASGLTIPALTRAGDAAEGRVLRKGENFEVTAELYEATLDRVGESFLDLDEQAQTTRWGMVRFAPGPAPENMEVGGDDEGFRYRQGLKAREYAQAISDPRERAEALRQVTVEYGDALSPVAEKSRYIPPSSGY